MSNADIEFGIYQYQQIGAFKNMDKWISNNSNDLSTLLILIFLVIQYCTFLTTPYMVMGNFSKTK